MSRSHVYAPCGCLFHDTDAIARRFPRLLRAMRWAAILSTNEALTAIRDYKHGWPGGEAVSHFGGPLRVIARAIECRSIVRNIYTERAEIIERLDSINAGEPPQPSAA